MRKRRKYKSVSIDGKVYKEHRLIMEKALGRKLDQTEAVHHIDDNGLNNDLANLQVIDEYEHNILTGRKYRPGSKLSIEDVPIIKKMLKDGIKQWLIAWIFRVARPTIGNIKTGYIWSWV